MESCSLQEVRLLLSEHCATFVPLLGEIDRLTRHLANQIELEPDSV